MLNKAIMIAIKAHEWQIDKAGEPYILHPIRVMLFGKTEEERICGVLHDVIEDTNISLELLSEEGFSEDIIIALNALTKKKGENYDDFIDRILQNELASKVKLADLKDNMDLSRIEEPKDIDYERLEKYRRARSRIEKKLHI